MKKELYLLIILVLQGCQLNQVTDISKIIENADRLPVKKSIYEITVDSTNSIFDTVVETKIKQNDGFVKVFEKKKFFKEKQCTSKIISYYSDNGNLVYEKTELVDRKFLSVFKAVEEGKTIKTSKSINYINGKIIDSTFLSYKYFYFGNKISKLVIEPLNDVTSNFKKVISYDDLNRVTVECSLFQNDTISKKIFFYNKEKDFKSVFYDYKKKSKIETKFDKDGQIISEESFTRLQSDYIRKDKVIYKKNKDGNILIFSD